MSIDSNGADIPTDNRLKLNTFTISKFCLDEEKNKSEPIYLTDGCGKENILFLYLYQLQNKIASSHLVRLTCNGV